MSPAAAADQRNPAQPPGSRHDPFVDFVRRLAKDPGGKARLRRSLRADATITADVWWVLGGWLSPDPDDALVMARVAAWAAVHDGQRTRFRTIAGELRSSPQVNEETARRILESVTREGIEPSVRCAHITRILPACHTPERVDWAQMLSDLTALHHDAARAHTVRARWYREYHNTPDPHDQPPTIRPTPRREHPPMTKTGFIDVHVLHSVPFSNLNRDNLGSPKQMIFGGTARSRISSQCTKRAARLWLEANTDHGKALRTRQSTPNDPRPNSSMTHGYG